MNILITGGRGFIGSHLAKYYLNNGHNITIITRKSTKNNLQGFEDKIKIIEKDVRNINKNDIKGIDKIFHCASTVDNYNIFDKPYIDAKTNILGTIALLEACKNHNPEVEIIFTSTFFVNGNPDILPVTDNIKEKPLGLYGATKLCAEHIINTYNRVFGLKTKIARLSNVFGVGEQNTNNKKAAFNRMIWLAVNNDTIKLYDNGKIKRDYIYIDDVINALEIIEQKGKSSLEQIYYISYGQSVSLKKLVDIILKEAGRGKIEIIESPNFHKAVGIDDFYCDISPLIELGWGQKITIIEGIKKVIQQYEIEVCNAK